MSPQLIIPLVNWTLGTVIIIVFSLVCLGLMLIVHRMVNSDSDRNKKD